MSHGRTNTARTRESVVTSIARRAEKNMRGRKKRTALSDMLDWPVSAIA